MNSVKIEILSILDLKRMITVHPLMQDYINSNDKEPSWDGNIYTYTNKDLKVENIEYKIPVQVKGKNNENLLYENQINYPIEYKHLKNYYEDGGVCYFVIVISDDGKITKVFFNALTPIKLEYFLKEKIEKNNHKTVSIPLKLIKDEHELYLKLKQFGYDRQQQGSGNGEIIKNSIDLSKIKDLKSIKVKAYGTNNIFDLMERISTCESCLYGKTSNLDIWRPVKYNQQLGSSFKPYKIINKSIKCNNKIYYLQYRVEFLDKTQIYIYLSENLKLKINSNDKVNHNEIKIELELNTKGTLKSISNDLDFLKDLLESQKIYSDDELFLEIKNSDLNFVEGDFKYFQIAEKALLHFNIKYNKKISNFKASDWEFINILIDIYSGDIPNFEGKFQIFNLEIDNKIIPFLFLKQGNNKIIGYNFLMPKGIKTTITYDNQKEYKIPSFIKYKQKEWNCLYEFEENLLLEEIKKSDFNIFTQNDFSLLFVELLLSYDFIQNETYYNMANLIADKLLELDPYNEYWKINKFQMLKRKGRLTEDDLKEISLIEETSKDDLVVCAANILLDNKYKSKTKIDKLPKEKRKIFMNFPIYNLL